MAIFKKPALPVITIFFHLIKNICVVNATHSSMLTLIEELLQYEYEHVLLAVIIIYRFCLAPALI